MNQQILFQRIEGAAVFAAATLLFFLLGFHWLAFVLLLFIFDISMIGYLFGRAAGALLYNIGHSFVLPSIVGVVGVLINHQYIIGLALLWFAHIGLDRALGYGLKASTGFRHTHLGVIGKRK